MKKIKAFTLAEVLITLAIIGVVAALTIPTIVAKYQKYQYYTKFMKTYNTLSAALLLSTAEHGPYESWLTLTNITRQQVFDDYISPYFKIKEICDLKTDNCSLKTMKVKQLDGSDYTYSPFVACFERGDHGKDFILTDGTLVCTDMFQAELDIYFDTNGIKEPNTFGRDIFHLVYGTFDGVPKLVGTHMRNYSAKQLYSKEKILSDLESTNINANCTTSQASVGYNCSTRLLLEGKMNY